MRTMGWGGVAALGLLAVASIASAQPPKSKAMPEGWWRDLFGPSKPREEAKMPDTLTPLPPDNTAALERIQKALDRRQEVCTRLREIAIQTNNPALEAEAERLDRMAFRVYQRQHARLLGTKARLPEDDEPEALAIPAAQPRPEASRNPGLGEGGR